MLFVMAVHAGKGQWHSSDIQQGCGKYKWNMSVQNWSVIAWLGGIKISSSWIEICQLERYFSFIEMLISGKDKVTSLQW